MFLIPLHPTNGDILELVTIPGGMVLDVRTREARDNGTTEYLLETGFSTSQIKKVLRSIHYFSSYFSDDNIVKIWRNKSQHIQIRKYGSANIEDELLWELDVEESKAFTNFLAFCAIPLFSNELAPYQFVKDPLVELLLADGIAFPQKLTTIAYWTNLGAQLGISGNRGLSTDCFEKALSIDPKCYEAKLNLAANLGEMHKFDEALQIISTIPNEVNRRNFILGKILEDSGREQEAIGYFEKAIVEEPDLYLPYEHLLQILEEAGGVVFEYYLEQAIQNPNVRTTPRITVFYCRYLVKQRKLIELSFVDWLDQLHPVNQTLFIYGPRNEELLIAEAKLAHSIAKTIVSGNKLDIQRAIDELQKFPEDWDLCKYAKLLISAAAQTGLPILIDKAYKRICPGCIEDNSILKHPDTIIACAYNVLGENEKAITLCEKVLAEDPNHLETLKHYCTFLNRANHPDKAVSVVEQIYKLNPKEPHIFYNLGYAYSRNGQFGKAQYWYQKQIDQDPDQYAAIENLVFIDLCKNQIEDARIHFDDYCQKMLAVEGSPNEEWHTVAMLTSNPELEEEKYKEQHAYLVGIIHRKTDKFNRLVELAQKMRGSLTFSLQLENANKADEPVLGAYTEIERNPFSLDNVLSTLRTDSEADHNEGLFQLEQKSRGDYSAILSELVSELPTFWRLPIEAQSALAEGEHRLRDVLTGDFSVSVVAYSKSVEVALRRMVLDQYRQKYQYRLRTEQATNVQLIGKRGGANKFLDFVEKGSFIGLGEIGIAFDLCNQHLISQAPCIRELRNFIEKTLKFQRLIDPKIVRAISELAKQYRNKAAHSDALDRNAALDARLLSISILSCFQPVTESS